MSSPHLRFPQLVAALAIVLSSVTQVAVACARQQDPLGRDPTPAATAERPRVGLVLSGGGARGAAHAGVLSVLEELRVPIDCVVGTSMGAIVGGLYAYGLSPERLAAILTREGMERDWGYLLHDGPRREDMEFRRKEDERRFLSRIRIGVRDGALAFPKGLLQGQNLEIELACLTLGAHDLRSFDDLPLPFRCVAVDIADGRQVVLGSGSLPAAMRASMSLPGFFAPAHVDGRDLLDGGLLDNVPVDVARELDVDVLIVVDIGTPLEMNPEIKDLFDVTGQVVAIMTEQNVRVSRASLGPDDVLITPDLGTITSGEFERAAEAIELARAAGRSVAERLGRFSVSAEEYAGFLQRQRRAAAPMPTIRSLRIENDSGLGEQLLETRLGLTIGAPLDPTLLRDGTERLYGTDDLERVAFSVRDWRDDAADLLVRVEEKSWGPSYVRLGLGLESNFEGQSTFNLGGQFSSRALNSLGAEWRTKLQVGQFNLIDSEFYQPLDAGGRWFVAPRLTAERSPARLYEQGQPIAEVEMTSIAFGVDGGMQLGRWGELRTGLEWKLGELDSGAVPSLNSDFQDAVARVLLQSDTLDNSRFPRSGNLTRFEYRAGLPGLGGDDRYQRFEATLTQAIPIGHATAVVGRVDFVTALRDAVPFHAEPSSGGFLNLSGFVRDSLRDQHSGLFALIGHHRLSESSAPFGIPLYVGGSVEAGNVWGTRAEFGGVYRLAGSAFVAVDTPLGPAFLAYGQAEGGVRSTYFFFGPFF